MYNSDFAKCWSRLTKDYKLHMDQELAPSLTEAQLAVLEVLEDHQKMKPSDLIPFLATTPAAVTMLLDRMEKNNLIRRDRDDNDRRIVWVSLSDKGRMETERGVAIRNDFMNSVLSNISMHNQQLLVYLLGKMTAPKTKEHALSSTS
ncbi:MULTISPECIES: MarR family winged helix-turn-helix transcriptional regulator [Paenibacillus]|uniref:MarR family winged helix-turn-helix transcriptional regulator n=1 Tax=Paenibacillus TaxID=44249 RepID=UPI000BA60C90|nr:MULTISPECIES: MarR family winged helix-turn-helix transcriptional regulator [Paenibacillus]MBM6387676.1 winged helix-turn-helix transcriptional regulator [Paenibacillus sp.]MBE7682404.1 MarR family transcriptional regulator [Paenibacillus sp. P13VS]MBY0220552.1 winged helix-turn-helix transcriptional regulator [Paenibacillus illinoisensis]MCM3207784.1 MarR family winged helix-turn-helix transcriptional regulator [Paenibacillus illinoisensis]PAD28392.1 MarR family transcriptional regulator [